MTDISFNNWASMSDLALIDQIAIFVKHHRLSQNKSQSILSQEAGISRSTLSLLERGETVTINTLIQVIRALGQLQIMYGFAIQKSISPLAIAKMEKDKRQRANNKIDK
jgi:transcriptional regulator with XRE-family HTH domain